ncbi:MAG: MarR family transcriptional regulator [Bdellovibrionales bacterium]|nr:MarR family transcriptional regulator [Bdellovibrionales bacterium]
MAFPTLLSVSDPKRASAKELVLHILSHTFPLTIADIQRSMERSGLKVTYQAVRKAVNVLAAQGVVERKEKKYQISHAWLMKMKEEVDRLLLRYRGKKTISDDDYAVYTIHTLYEADIFWGDLLYRFLDIARSQGDTTFYSFWHYAWWMVINLGRETQLFEYFQEKGHTLEQYIFRDLPINRWASEIYTDIGVQMHMKDLPSTDHSIAYNIFGEFILQVEFPQEAIERIQGLFESHSSMGEIERSEITSLAHTPYEVSFTVIRNRKMAENLCKTLRREFV